MTLAPLNAPAQDTATTCRERCGGQGYLSVNRFGSLLGFAHAGMTAEGDNRWGLALGAEGGCGWGWGCGVGVEVVMVMVVAVVEAGAAAGLAPQTARAPTACPTRSALV